MEHEMSDDQVAAACERARDIRDRDHWEGDDSPPEPDYWVVDEDFFSDASGDHCLTVNDEEGKYSPALTKEMEKELRSYIYQYLMHVKSRLDSPVQTSCEAHCLLGIGRIIMNNVKGNGFYYEDRELRVKKS